MVTVKSSQKIFTDSEVASLTGICVDHIHNFAKSRHLGFIARAADRSHIVLKAVQAKPGAPGVGPCR